MCANKKCKQCGVEFHRIVNGGAGQQPEYCSVRCRQIRASGSIWEGKCRTCGREIKRRHGVQGRQRCYCDECGSPGHKNGRRIYRGKKRITKRSLQQCACCGAMFVSTRKRFCSPRCRKLSYPARVHYHECKFCKRLFASRTPGQETCSVRCKNKWKLVTKYGSIAAWREVVKQRRTVGGNHVARAKRFGVAYEYFSKKEIYDRDGWTCGICNKPVDKTIRYPNRECVSLDHIQPMSRGGPHTRDNVQCSHYSCNCAKSDLCPDLENQQEF